MSEFCFVNSLPGILDPEDGSVATSGSTTNKGTMAYTNPDGSVDIKIDGPYPLEGDIYNVENIQWQVFISKEDVRNKIPVFYRNAFGRKGLSILKSEMISGTNQLDTTMHKIINFGYLQGKLYVKNRDTGNWIELSSVIPDISNDYKASSLNASELTQEQLEEISKNIDKIAKPVIYSEVDDNDSTLQNYYLRIKRSDLILARGTYVVRIFKEILSEDYQVPEKLSTVVDNYHTKSYADMEGVDPVLEDPNIDLGIEVSETSTPTMTDEYWVKNETTGIWEAVKIIEPNNDILGIQLDPSETYDDPIIPPETPVEFEQIKVFTLTAKSNPIQGFRINREYWRTSHPRGYNMDSARYRELPLS